MFGYKIIKKSELDSYKHALDDATERYAQSCETLTKYLEENVDLKDELIKVQKENLQLKDIIVAKDKELTEVKNMLSKDYKGDEEFEKIVDHIQKMNYAAELNEKLGQ